MKKRLCFMFTIAMLVLAGTAFASGTSVPMPVKIEPVETEMKPGKNLIRIRVDARPDCETVQLEITELKGITYAGEFSWQGQLTGRDKFEKRYECVIEVDVPDNDTSYIEITARSRNFLFSKKAYFISENGKVNFYFMGLPRPSPKPELEKPRILTREEFLKNASEEDLAKEYEIVMAPANNKELNEIHSILKVLPEPNSKGHYFVTTTLEKILEIGRLDIDADFTKGRPWGHSFKKKLVPVPTLKQVRLSAEELERARRESERTKKERLEQSPLVGQPIQTVWIGDTSWTRYEGETVFKRWNDSLVLNQPKLFQAYVDSVALLPDDTEIDVCIYLPDSIHVARVREIVPDIPIDFSAKFFHATLTKAWIKKLREMRFYVQYVHAKPHQYHGPDAPKDIRRKLN